MKIAYATTYDASELTGSNDWSGSGYHISQSLENQGLMLEDLGPLEEKLIFQILQKAKRQCYQTFHNKYYEKDSDLLSLKDYAHQVSKKISVVDTDIVFSATIRPIVYLECRQPIVFWADATCAGIVGFYPQYDNLCRESLENWHMMEKLALERCKLAIYASGWAAQTAIDYYGADPAKVKVVPFGANIDSSRTLSETKDLIETRSSKQCKLLFLGVDWFRKGGDVAFKVAEELNHLGVDTELTVVGCQPILEKPLPSFVKPLGFISKSTADGKNRINQLLAESHFLILPSRAECYGVVFCEANSFGVPCIATNVGGIPTIIKPNLNGNLFDLNASTSAYCDYIYHLFTNYEDYKKLALSAFNEYQSRLNWDTAGKIVKNLLVDIVS